MKKTIIFILIILSVFSLCSCGAHEKQEEFTTDVVTVVTDKTPDTPETTKVSEEETEEVIVEEVTNYETDSDVTTVPDVFAIVPETVTEPETLTVIAGGPLPLA